MEDKPTARILLIIHKNYYQRVNVYVADVVGVGE